MPQRFSAPTFGAHALKIFECDPKFLSVVGVDTVATQCRETRVLAFPPSVLWRAYGGREKFPDMILTTAVIDGSVNCTRNGAYSLPASRTDHTVRSNTKTVLVTVSY